AKATVKHAMMARRLDDSLSAYERSEGGIKHWLLTAALPGGAAIFEIPDHIHVRYPENAYGTMESKFIVATLAHHIRSTKGSVRADDVRELPIGAVALTLASVERAFKHYARNDPSVKMDAFSKGNAGTLTASWANKVYGDLVLHEERFESLLQKVANLLALPEVKAADHDFVMEESSMYYRQRSSPPPEAADMW
ncbi:uncharacterized protein BXZ73DRAFT_57874, partial [Epithele typhae]|uniref:uncharacterized protein n=1 Tax=Epithele typhae TaxID=378194 RepID=UPI00200859FE